MNDQGTRLWTALGTSARSLAVLDVSTPTKPRFLRIVTPPFPAHDVVWAPGGEHVWVTSGARRAIAVYPSAAIEPVLILPAAAPPQHIAFSRSRAYVASGDDGAVRVHTFDGAVVRTASRVPAGSYNITFGGNKATVGPVVVTPSLDRGTVCLLSPGGSVQTVKKVARSAHDACVVEAG